MEVNRRVHLEIHVAYSPPEIPINPTSKRSARVKHIVIRLPCIPYASPDGNMLESMEAPMTRLSALRTVTLEIPDADGYADLGDGLARLRAGGLLRLRTCKEAQQVAQAAKQNPHDYSDDQGVISPLWYRDKMESTMQQMRWCVNISRIMPW